MIQTYTIIATPNDLDREIGAVIASLHGNGHTVTQISQPVATIAQPTKLVVMLVYRLEGGGQ